MPVCPIYISRSSRSEEVTLDLEWIADIQKMDIWGKLGHRHRGNYMVRPWKGLGPTMTCD